jgi:hypothetical protein
MRAWIMSITLMFAVAEAATKVPPRPPPLQKDEEQQADDEQDSSEEDSKEMGDSEVSEHAIKPATPVSPRSPASPRSDAVETSPGQVHTVVRGDTLWDLSQHYLGSPWYWPKVWSYNPEIANPHWIYPGNRVRFYLGGEEAPSEVDVATEPAGRVGDDGEDVSSPDSINLDHESEVRVSGKIGYQPKRGVRVSHQGFLTSRQLEQSGVIDSSFAETVMLSYPDTVYIRFPKNAPVKVGERYIVFRTAAEIVHPKTNRRVGYLTHILGTARVIKSGELVTAQLNADTWDEVKRGDRIGPAGEQLNEVIERRANDRELKGYIIGVLIPYLTTLGEHNVIIIDKGHSDGVQPGQTFTVVRQQDPLTPKAFLYPARVQDSHLPVEDIGTCMAIDVKDVATMCLVTRSLRELVYGDRVEMRPEAAKEPRAALR